MRQSVIILTSGLTGSSVLTGLIARAGYWTGDATFKKQQYETFENQRLIDLNRMLFQKAGYEGNYLLEFPAQAIQEIESLHRRIDCSDFQSFVEYCNQHRPWVWKDPRLWMTIRFWKRFLDLNDCGFILLTRSSMQSWISSTLRRQITTYRYSKEYESRIKDSIVDFLEKNKLSYLHLQYETLIADPNAAITELNRHLKTGLTVDDLKDVYHKPLYKLPRNSWPKHVRAMLIYLKNYSERLDIAAKR